MPMIVHKTILFGTFVPDAFNVQNHQFAPVVLISVPSSYFVPAKS
jgi:hypothetical protein